MMINPPANLLYVNKRESPGFVCNDAMYLLTSSPGYVFFFVAVPLSGHMVNRAVFSLFTDTVISAAPLWKNTI